MAVERTLAVKSLRVVLSNRREGIDDRFEVDYEAPDRARLIATGEPTNETIYAGNAVYVADPTRAGFFTVSTFAPGQGSPRGVVMFPVLLLQHRRHVTRDGGAFSVDLDDGTAEVELADGYVTRVRLHLEREDAPVEAVYLFSDFNEELPPIEAPPADRVVQAHSSQPACGPDGAPRPGETVCVYPPGSPTPRPIALPPPSGSTASTLQFRPVLADASSPCTDAETNPDPSAGARLPGDGVACYDLGPAELEVDAVASLRAMPGRGDLVNLEVTLASDDAARFDDIAERRRGQRIAVVMFGRVLRAPAIGATGYGGQLQISDLTLDLASRVNAALAS